MSRQDILNPWLLEKLQNGDCILFLGAGASIGSVGPRNERAPKGAELRDGLADKFLGGLHKDKPLTRVAEFAKYESSLVEVQVYIRSLFLPLHPAPFHRLIPLFRWHALVTTNYDLVIERAYDEVGKRQQQLCPIVRDGDNFASVLKDQNAVPYLKLHGCINTVNDPTLPLILGSEEYAKYKQNRTRLFNHFADWARERPVIFVGYDISDPNIQQILFALTDLGIHRPTYAVVDPSLDAIACRYWAAHRFVPEAITFQNFLEAIDREIPTDSRVLASIRQPGVVSVSHWFQTNLSPSSGLVRYLHEELEHVHPSLSFPGLQPKDFYSGNSTNWAAFDQELDQKRWASDELIVAAVLENTGQRGPLAYLLKGHAGAGKTVCLRRFAWDAAKDFDGKVLLLKEGGVVRSDLILEIAELTGEPIVVVVDDALRHAFDLNRLYRDAARRLIPIRLVIGARTNEWNISGSDFEFPLTEEYELKELKASEIDGLIKKLEQHNSLGELASLSRTEQQSHFNLNAGRQLMVALHEATTGKRFHEIAFDEYLHIQPVEARTLYLDICTLHRLGVAVRAGLISRVSGITFDHFSQEMFRPLEHVVHSYFDAASRDYAYKTRHQIIAEFVFEQALPDPVERAAQITRILRHMDTDYESDSIAFSQLIRGRTLAELFADKVLVRQIFEAALESGAPVDYIKHQAAVFELHHPHSDLTAALRAITEAESSSEGRDKSILHTKAMVLRRLALGTAHRLEREKHRADAKSILQRLQASARHSHAFDTYGRLLLDELRDHLEAIGEGEPNELTQRSLSDQIRKIEEVLSTGLQRFPEDDHLLALDADLAKMLEDEPRALASLKAAAEASPGRPFIAVRLASAYEKQGKVSEALDVLRDCLQHNPSSKQCHLQVALILMGVNESQNRTEIQYHLRRSFTEGDANFDAQFWYARHEMLFGDANLASEAFRKLSASRTAPAYRNKIRGSLVDANGHPTVFSGHVRNLGIGYCFVATPELRFKIHLRQHVFSPADWEKIREGVNVKFEVGFNLRGPTGTRAWVAT